MGTEDMVGMPRFQGLEYESWEEGVKQGEGGHPAHKGLDVTGSALPAFRDPFAASQCGTGDWHTGRCRCCSGTGRVFSVLFGCSRGLQ